VYRGFNKMEKIIANARGIIISCKINSAYMIRIIPNRITVALM
jgi:hypothetical protein